MKLTLESLAPMLAVKDVKATVSYFCECLGFEKLFVAESDTIDTYGVVTRDGNDIHFLETTNRSNEETRCGINVYVSDVDALYEEFKSNGAFHEDFPRDLDSIREHPPEDKEYGLRDFIFVESNGYILVFGQPL